MAKKKDIRFKIFDIFSKNLEIVKNHPSIRFEPDFTDGYLCPICFDPYFKSDLDFSSPNCLTLEDVPPKSLGGNPKLLTCKNCNSICGYELDKNLFKRLEEIDARELLPTSYKTTFFSNGSEMNGIVNIDKEGHWTLKLKNEWSNPKKAEQFMKEVFPPRTIYNPFFYPEKRFESYKTNNFSIKFPSGSIERKAEIALLKTAYLLAFSKFGYSFLINGALYRVREQILNPDKDILPKVFGINYVFPEDVIGLNLITEPNELRCYLIIFDLKTKGKKRQFAVALPGLTKPGIKIYENIEKLLCVNSGGFTNMKLEHINDFDFVKDPESIWGAHWFWQKFCHD